MCIDYLILSSAVIWKVDILFLILLMVTLHLMKDTHTTVYLTLITDSGTMVFVYSVVI